MTLDLDRKDLESLVKGTPPCYTVYNNQLVKRCGTENASYGTWHWNHFTYVSDEELLELYYICKNSWI